MAALEIGLFVLALPFVVTYALQHYTTAWANTSLLLSFQLVCVYLTGIFTSTLVYRAFFHPLRQFPGPTGAKLSKFWTLWKVYKADQRWYLQVPELHKKYGDYVRTGPRELTIGDPNALPHVLGFQSKAFKGSWYDSMEESISTTRDRVFHKQRRKVYDSAIKQLLTTYTPTLEGVTSQLLERIARDEDKPILVNTMTHDYSYDILTQLVFGEPQGFVTGLIDQKALQIFSSIDEAVAAIGYVYNAPWIMSVLTRIGRIAGPMKIFNDWSHKTLQKRKETGMKKPDLIEEIIANTSTDAFGQSVLHAEARTLIGAGSDTTATCMAEILIILANHPEYVQKLREELDPLLRSGDFFCQATYPILDSIINETLRMYPTVLFPSARETPAEGIQIGDVYIPPFTGISMNVWHVHHDPRNFAYPDDFIPERWTTKPELVLNRAAFIPFTIGPANCPGKPLAMMELRSTISRIIHQYDVSFPEGAKFNEREFFAKIKDYFVAFCPRQELVFSRRMLH
ncbi:putative benzoate 4-monooxygenase cytochrome P450 [Pleomassaria siparia CBS 279.74]|uniref:Putative benzoate 4-monooxygenase cytochrome P450 n=1 Tax=Pleomassaria siparia CBS 279.74 TaxID=1314801 RepID=A0A6G1K4U1_9PLEO|nr:putative benzoate 4-monooxygenase cytochrome P450 [Pleomassaria siparia CBS 279.74]